MVFQSILILLGQCQVDIFATRLNHQLPQYVSWRPYPFAMAMDAFQVCWTNVEGYAFPPFPLLGRCLQKVRQEQSTLIIVALIMASTGVVSTPSGTASPASSVAPKPPILPQRPLRAATPTINDGTTSTSRLESFRNNHLADGISSRSSRLILAGWSKGTNIAYESARKKWVSWCSEQRIDPFSCNVRPFLDFLASLYEKGLQHRTINTIHSAVSMTHDRVEGQQPMVSRLLKGIYNLRPPQPRYSETWDVDIVVQFLSTYSEDTQSETSTSYTCRSKPILRVASFGPAIQGL